MWFFFLLEPKYIKDLGRLFWGGWIGTQHAEMDSGSFTQWKCYKETGLEFCFVLFLPLSHISQSLKGIFSKDICLACMNP